MALKYYIVKRKQEYMLKTTIIDATFFLNRVEIQTSWFGFHTWIFHFKLANSGYKPLFSVRATLWTNFRQLSTLQHSQS